MREILASLITFPQRTVLRLGEFGKLLGRRSTAARSRPSASFPWCRASPAPDKIIHPASRRAIHPRGAYRQPRGGRTRKSPRSGRCRPHWPLALSGRKRHNKADRLFRIGLSPQRGDHGADQSALQPAQSWSAICIRPTPVRWATDPTSQNFPFEIDSTVKLLSKPRASPTPGTVLLDLVLFHNIR